MGNKELWDEVDRLAYQYKSMPEAGNSAARSSIRYRFAAALQEALKKMPSAHARGEDIYGVLLSETYILFETKYQYKSVDKETGAETLNPFSHYFKSLMKDGHFLTNIYRKETDSHRIRQSENKSKDKDKKDKGKEEWVSPKSLNETCGGEDDDLPEFIDLLADSTTGDEHTRQMEVDIQMRETVLKYIELIMIFPQRLKGKEKNGKRMTFFRMFMTERYVMCLKEAVEDKALLDREICRGLDFVLMDFFLAKICRTNRQIVCTSLKPYGAMVKGRRMDKLCVLPLPNDVYIAFLDAHSEEEPYHQLLADKNSGHMDAPTISQQKKECNVFLQRELA